MLSITLTWKSHFRPPWFRSLAFACVDMVNSHFRWFKWIFKLFCILATKKSSNDFIYATSILVYSLVHFILGLIVHSNPIASNNLKWVVAIWLNSSAKISIFRLLLDKSNALINCVYVPLINLQLLTLYESNSSLVTSIVITTLLTAFLCLTDNCWRLFLDAFIVAQSMLLAYLSITHDEDNYWLITLPFLAALNFFTLPLLASHYCVPKQELLSVSLIFQNLFLMNAFFWELVAVFYWNLQEINISVKWFVGMWQL